MHVVEAAASAPDEVYHLLTALVTPRPIGWVSTVSAEGVPNIAPFGCYSVCGFQPPMVFITDNNSTTDTLRNIRETGEFVCNVVSFDHVQAMNFTAITFPPGENEFDWAGLSTAPSQKIVAPRIAEARASIECRLHQFVEFGRNTMILGEVVAMIVDPAVMRDGRVEPELLRPIGRYAGNRYAEGAGLYRLPRVTWDELRAIQGETQLAPFEPERWQGRESVGDDPPFYGSRKQV